MQVRKLSITFVLIVFLTALCLTTHTAAQFEEGGDPGGASLGKSRTQRWKAGMIVTAEGGGCKGVVGYAPMPVDWPEQTVKIVDEDITKGAKITYRTARINAPAAIAVGRHYVRMEHETSSNTKPTISHAGPPNRESRRSNLLNIPGSPWLVTAVQRPRSMYGRASPTASSR